MFHEQLRPPLRQCHGEKIATSFDSIASASGHIWQLTGKPYSSNRFLLPPVFLHPLMGFVALYPSYTGWGLPIILDRFQINVAMKNSNFVFIFPVNVKNYAILIWNHSTKCASHRCASTQSNSSSKAFHECCCRRVTEVPCAMILASVPGPPYPRAAFIILK